MCLKYNVNTSDSIKSYTGTSKKLKYFRKNSQNKLLSYRYMHFSLKIISVMSFLAWGQIKKLKRERKRERVYLGCYSWYSCCSHCCDHFPIHYLQFKKYKNYFIGSSHNQWRTHTCRYKKPLASKKWDTISKECSNKISNSKITFEYEIPLQNFD